MTPIIELLLEDRDYPFCEIEGTTQQTLQQTLHDIPQLESVLKQNNALTLRRRAIHVF